MPDLLDRTRKELEARIRRLRPLVRELERLERAAAALARAGASSVLGLRSRGGEAKPDKPAPSTSRAAGGKGSSARRTTRKSAAKKAAAPGAGPRRKSAPRGQTQARILDALAAAPGSSTASVAEASGVSPNVTAATISRLVKQGRVRRLEDGGYAVAEAPAKQSGA